MRKFTYVVPKKLVSRAMQGTLTASFLVLSGCVSQYGFDAVPQIAGQIATPDIVGAPSDPANQPAPQPPVVVVASPAPVPPSIPAPQPSAAPVPEEPVVVILPPAPPVPEPEPPIVVPPAPPEEVVCDPFGGGVNGSRKSGLRASLTYLPLGSSRIGGSLRTSDFAPGEKDVEVSPATIYLSRLNAPTTIFSDGFKDGNGKALQNKNGEDLIEYFSLRSEGMIMANNDAESGEYEFALLSDDGSVMKIDPSGKGDFRNLIDNEGTHANILACSSEHVTLVKGIPLPIQINYFQGPRYRIAQVLIWRKVQSASEPECGRSQGDDYFFNSASGSPVGTEHWGKVLKRGWSIVPGENLYLPMDAQDNPCAKK